MSRRGKPLSAALVGTCLIGPVHVEGLRSVGVHVDGSTLDKAQAAAEQFSLLGRFTTLAEVLADPHPPGRNPILT